MAEQVVRWATIEDGVAIGRVHVRAWQAATDTRCQTTLLRRSTRLSTAGCGPRTCGVEVAKVKTRGCGEAILWVLDTNVRAQRFYEKAGWCADGHERMAEVRGFAIRDLRYRRTL